MYILFFIEFLFHISNMFFVSTHNTCIQLSWKNEFPSIQEVFKSVKIPKSLDGKHFELSSFHNYLRYIVIILN